MHEKAINQKNANAMVTSVMGATLLKLLVLASAAFIYLFLKKSANVTYTLFIVMFMYIIYTALEVRTALKMNDKNGNK
jgi:cobalamin biosynthesis protein CobD/CbiB